MLASTIAPIANVSLDKKNSLDMDTFLNRETELRQRIVPGVGKIKLTLKFDGVQVILFFSLIPRITNTKAGIFLESSLL